MDTEALGPSIRAIGLAVPDHCLAQDDLCDFMVALHGLDRRRARMLRTLYRRSGIDARHVCLGDLSRPTAPFGFSRRAPRDGRDATTARRMEVYRREAPRLAAAAARRALGRDGGVAPDAVDHLFVATCTGFFAPSVDVTLAESLGLRADVGRTLVGFQGCQAGLTALRLAEQACRARPGATVLVVCVELCSLHFQLEGTDDDLLANALFADGAAAVVVAGGAVPRTGRALAIERCATWLLVDAAPEMTWNVGDHGFRMHLGRRLPRIVGRDARAFVREHVLDAARRAPADCDWAVHPGGVAVLDAVEESFELAPEALRHSREVLARHGNMSSPTIHFVLDRILDSSTDGRPVVALAFGPGLTIEAASLRVLPS